MKKDPTPMMGRVFNYSSLPVLIYAEDRDKPANNGWYRLAPGCETPAEFDVSVLMPSRGGEGDVADATILGAKAWRIAKSVVHVVDRPRPRTPQPPGGPKDLLIRIAGLGCTPADDVEMSPEAFEKIRDLTLVPRRPWVTVLGAGIAGLTAAHELIERGFQVQVVEKSHGSPVIEDENPDFRAVRFQRGLVEPDIGGIARTQWSTAPMDRKIGQTSIFSDLKKKHDPELPKDHCLERTKSIHGDGDWWGAELESWDYEKGTALAIPFSLTNQLVEPKATAAITKWLEYIKANSSVAAIQIVVVIYRPTDGGPSEIQGPDKAYERLRALLAWLPEQPAAKIAGLLEDFPVARIEVDGASPAAEFPGLLIRYHDQLGLIAGEHGFRFFPGFYRHLRDTMKRTPIYDALDNRFTERTAHDNLTEVRFQTIEDPTRRHGSSFLREKFSSFGAMVNQYSQLRSDLGYRPSDLLRFMLRMTRFMTSSTKRRKLQYEGISWWTFLSVRHLHTEANAKNPALLPYGERFSRAIKHSPEALVAMKADKADARTQGNISVQLAMDQFNLHEHTDSTLSGPTSESWFRHWREYLKQQGVRFYVGEVTSITYPSAGYDPAAPDPGFPKGVQVTIAFPGGKRPHSFFAPTGTKAESRQPHYYVSAMDAIAVKRVTTELRAKYDEQVKVLGKIARLVSGENGTRNPEKLTVSQDEQLPYQTLSGIQLYYLPRISFEPAHIYYADSAWGLSAVSQVQYWGPIGTGGHHSKLLGNLSLDIGSWRPRKGQPELTDAPDPSLCRPYDIADEVWKQITAGRSIAGPTPSYYHLDDYIQFQFRDAPGGKKLLPTWNRSPFLINDVNGWNARPPGEPWSPSDRRAHRERIPGDGKEYELVWRHRNGGYEVYFDNLVFAGTHMRTFTRMGTMEAANESARHAVNAILDHLTFDYRKYYKVPTPPPPPKNSVSGIREPNVPEQIATPFGDYCDIWNPEQNEFADLDFLKLIDKHLFENHKPSPRSSDDVVEGHTAPMPPHLFDLLGVDRLPDLIDNDADATKVFDLLRTGLAQLKESQSADLAAVLANVESLKKLFATYSTKAK